MVSTKVLLTPRQKRFVEGKLNGLGNTEAAIHAGYTPSGANRVANGLMKHPKVKAALKKGVVPGDDGPLTNKKMQRKSYTDPVTFLEDVMNHPELPIAARQRAAEQLLPYKHARIAEKGKKETVADRGKKVASEGRFKTKAPPRSATVTPIFGRGG